MLRQPVIFDGRNLYEPAVVRSHGLEYFAIGRPALHASLYWLVVITMINAAIAAAYYLRIVGTLFLRGGSGDDAVADEPVPMPPMPWPITTAIVLSVFGTLIFGTIVPATQLLVNRVTDAAQLEPTNPHGTPTATASR